MPVVVTVMVRLLDKPMKINFCYQYQEEIRLNLTMTRLRVPSKQMIRHMEGKVCVLHIVGEIINDLHVRTTGTRELICSSKNLHAS